MITTNVLCALKANYSGTNPRGKTFNGDLSISISMNQGSNFGSDLKYTTYPESNWDGIYLLVGSGDSEESINSYRLDSVISSYTCVSQTHTLDTNFNNNLLTVVRVIQNTSTENITIKEVGLFAANYMVAREVLETPITIQPGEKIHFKYGDRVRIGGLRWHYIKIIDKLALLF